MSKLRYGYGYVRVSTVKQVVDGGSIQQQKDAINEWANQNNCKILAMEVDEGMSGTLKAKDRPGLKKALGYLKKDNILITYSFSRLSRDIYEAMHILGMIKERQAKCVWVDNGGNNLDGIVGEFTSLSLAMVANYHAAFVSENTKEAAETNRLLGRHQGGIPYGWKKKSEDKGSGLIEDEQEQQVIHFIKHLRAELTPDVLPTPYTHIAKRLNDEEIPAPRSKVWYASTVKRICERGEVRTLGRDDV